MTRHESREIAFLILFENIFSSEEDTVDTIIESAKEAREIKVSNYALTLVNGVNENIDHIDELIKQYATNWDTNRMSKVSLSLLRLAFYELENEKDIDGSIITNEVVELAKSYGGDDDPAFVNGILGSFIRAEGK